MSVEIVFPVEFMVFGVPISLQASTVSKEAWKKRIREVALKELPAGHFVSEDPIKLTIYYFADTPANFDIDNILKPILDSLNGLIYVDDKQVEQLVVQKFEPGRLFTFSSPSPKLAETIDAEGSRVFLKIDISAIGEI